MRRSPTTLCGDLDVEVTPDAPLASRTWYGLGGRADLLVRPRTVEAIGTLLARCHRDGVPLRVLGSGANLLVDDDGVDGVVLLLDHSELATTTWIERGDAGRLSAGAGCDLARILMEAGRRGWWGLEQMAGIPASVGGAVRMNAGGAFGCIADAVEEVVTITRAGRLVTRARGEITFDYRHADIPDPLILSARLALWPGDPLSLRDRIKEIFQYKKASQPLAEHSAGCVFRNPVDPVTGERVSAGKLIDEAGLKGHSIGGATVSDRHANFITVRPGACARDVRQLMEFVQRAVRQRRGFELVPEIAIWTRGEENI